MRKILVGQQPGKLNPPSKPLWAEHAGSTGYRIAMMAGLERDEYHEVFERFNINTLTDVKFSVTGVTKARGLRIRTGFREGDLIVALGKEVCECLQLPVPDNYFEFQIASGLGYMYAVIPHPSGLNRFYNSRDNWLQAEDFMRAIVAYPEEYDPDEHPWNKPEADDE